MAHPVLHHLVRGTGEPRYARRGMSKPVERQPLEARGLDCWRPNPPRLESREELEDAVRRAAAFERRMADMLELRACRYEALLERPADILALPDRPLDPPSETAAEQPLSA
jgi:hypothetical protein